MQLHHLQRLLLRLLNVHITCSTHTCRQVVLKPPGRRVVALRQGFLNEGGVERLSAGGLNQRTIRRIEGGSFYVSFFFVNVSSWSEKHVCTTLFALLLTVNLSSKLDRHVD